MSDRAYWLSLFNQTTWQEFSDSEAEVMGFPETRQNSVRRIKQVDYLTGVFRWIAVLEVTSEPYDDLAHIWKQAIFHCQVNVEVVASVEPKASVPAFSLSQGLQMFNILKTPNWGLLFRIAPRELTFPDGETIVTAITKAK